MPIGFYIKNSELDLRLNVKRKRLYIMQRLILFLICLYSSEAIAEANYLNRNSNQFNRYVVVKGESLRKGLREKNHSLKNTKTWKTRAKHWKTQVKKWEGLAKEWKAEAEEWKTKAKIWESSAKVCNAKYGWINDQHSFCSMNKSVGGGIFGGEYDSPTCYKPMKPFCVNSLYSKCSEWEVQSYNTELEQWVNCRKEYIRQAKDDAGCALVKIKEGIEKAIDGN